MIYREVVYLDVVLTINWLLDYFILWAAARIGQLSCNWQRLALAATLGAFYALLPFTGAGKLALDIGGKFSFSLLMIWVAYRNLNIRSFISAVLYFYLVAFAMAGAMLGAIYFFDARLDSYGLLNGLVSLLGRVRFTWLLVALGAAFILARWGAPLLRRGFLSAMFQVPVVIRFANQRLAVRALVDTGNQLRDPLTQKPVVIVEYEVLRPLLPTAITRCMEDGSEPDLGKIASELRGTPWASRVHLVPFSSIGRPHGMLLCFRPDEVVVVTNDRMARIQDVLVGVYRHRLSPQGTYRALLHPDILQAVC